MGGWKTFGSASMCAGPCCPGYSEVIERRPLLPKISACKKDQFYPDKMNYFEKMRIIKKAPYHAPYYHDKMNYFDNMGIIKKNRYDENKINYFEKMSII